MVLHMMMDIWSVVTNAGKIPYAVRLLFLNVANLWLLFLEKIKSLLKGLMNAFFWCIATINAVCFARKIPYGKEALLEFVRNPPY